MNEKELNILQELEELCREYQSLQNRSNMDSRRLTISKLFAACVFRDYCPLYWKRDDIKNAGLEISKTITSVFANYNPKESEFSHYLNSALKNAILKGRQNAIVGDSENLKKIQKDTIADSETALSNEPTEHHSTETVQIDDNILDTITRTWERENERHRPFLSLYLNSIFYKFGNYGDLCGKCKFLSVASQEFSPSMQQQEMAAKYGIEKTNASKIIARFKAKMPYLQSTLKNNRT